MNPGPKLRRRTMLALAALAVTVAPAALPAPAAAAFDPICGGRAALGESRADGEVKYFFSCSDPVAGFALVALNRQIDGFETELVALDPAGEAGGALACSGEIPSNGFGCTAVTAIRSPNKLPGTFNVAGDRCTGRRLNAVVFVTSAKGEVAGPYSLVTARPGPATRPLDGCPPPPRRVVRRTVRR